MAKSRLFTEFNCTQNSEFTEHLKLILSQTDENVYNVVNLYTQRVSLRSKADTVEWYSSIRDTAKSIFPDISALFSIIHFFVENVSKYSADSIEYWAEDLVSTKSILKTQKDKFISFIRLLQNSSDVISDAEKRKIYISKVMPYLYNAVINVNSIPIYKNSFSDLKCTEPETPELTEVHTIAVVSLSVKDQIKTSEMTFQVTKHELVFLIDSLKTALKEFEVYEHMKFGVEK